MHMSQKEGFLLTDIKLCPETRRNELDELGSKIGGRRGRPKKKDRLIEIANELVMASNGSILWRLPVLTAGLQYGNYFSEGIA